ncbi:TPA: RusA family crossover junction endodeoxyribonuclease [Citrobacter amalonaticus]
MKLVLPFPPSVNTYWRAPNKGPLAGRHLISAKGRQFQSSACAAIIEQLRMLPKPSSSPAAVEIILFPPDNRIREDDSQVKRMLVEWGPIIPKGKVEITITKFEPGAGAAA